jgi:hypothetical protein
MTYHTKVPSQNITQEKGRQEESSTEKILEKNDTHKSNPPKKKSSEKITPRFL